MRVSLVFLALTFVVAACNSSSEEGDLNDTENTEPLEGREPSKIEWKLYENSRFNLAFKYPTHWRVVENMDEEFPVINVFPAGQEKMVSLPYRIHHEAELSFVSIFPKSFGTELPSGRSQSLAGNERFTGKAFNTEESTALLLENNHVWALHLPFNDKFEMADGAYLFAQIAVSNFKAKCLDESGKEISVEDCDPMGGDTFQRYATINENHRQIIQKIVASMRSLDEKEAEPTVTDLRVMNPQPNQQVSSPLRVNGKARGFWFFEGDFPVRIEDREGKILGESYASAQGEWMTDKMVDFSAKISFEAPTGERGYLVLEKQNAAGKDEPETYRVPVIFVAKQ